MFTRFHKPSPSSSSSGPPPPSLPPSSLESEITPRLRTWRQALDRCRSAPQLCLCILQLEKAIAWERSVVKLVSCSPPLVSWMVDHDAPPPPPLTSAHCVGPHHQNCQVCRKGDNDEYLLLCDGCDRGCHMYCLRPKVTQVPEGDWFCPTCTAKVRLTSVAVATTSQGRIEHRWVVGYALSGGRRGREIKSHSSVISGRYRGPLRLPLIGPMGAPGRL